MSFTTRLLLVDDHQLFTDGLKALLNNDSTLCVAGVADSPESAIKLAGIVSPDIALVELSLGRASGFSVLRQLTDVRVCVVSMHSEPHFILQAFRLGAFGYVCKGAAGAELIEAVHAVSRGETYLCSLAKKATFSIGGPLVRSEKNSMTQREAEVLTLAGQGRTAGEIAERLGISRRTAEAHRAHVMKKLALKSQTDLVLYAVRSGIVSP